MLIDRLQSALDRRRLERLQEECRRVMFDIESPGPASLQSGFSLGRDDVTPHQLVAVIHHFVPSLLPITGIFGDDIPHAWLEIAGQPRGWIIDPHPLLIHPGPVLIGLGPESPFLKVYHSELDLRNQHERLETLHDKIEKVIQHVERLRSCA